MKINEVKNLEMTLLLEAIFHLYGHDFRNYAQASIYRRVEHFKELSGFVNISDMIPKVIHDPIFFQALLMELSVTVTEMFRDPLMFLSLRKNILPYLKSYSSVKIWHAGCATGQEAYSLAILLEEENISKKTTIYATDFNDIALEKAKQGIFKLDNIKKYTENYQAAGGKKSFSEYYHARYNAIVLKQSLKDNIAFANHNLVTDGVFSEIHLILCRNVLIYFDQELQKRVMQLFYDCLINNGFLCLGNKESLLFSSHKNKFITIDDKNKIFQKRE